MKRLLVIVVFVVLSVSMAQTRWQYGRLSLSNRGGVWSTTELGLVRGETYDEFDTALTGVAAPQVEDPNVVILDLLGSWGWELVANDGTFYIFKRRIQLKNGGGEMMELHQFSPYLSAEKVLSLSKKQELG